MSTRNLCFLIVVSFLLGTVSAIADETFDPALLQKVEDDYMAMMPMTRDERQAYWQANVNDLERSERLTYQRAYKSLVPSLPAMPPAAGSSSGATDSNVRVPGTNITYDAGVGTGTQIVPSSIMFGNQFDVALNGAGTMTESVETTGSVTQITFSMNTAAGSDNVFWSLMSNVSGTMASVVTSASIPTVPGLNTVTVAVPYSNGTFLAGVWFISGDTLQGSTGTVGGQGFHGISINDIAATGLQPATSGGMGVNAIFRVSGDVLQATVPVELMDFTIED